MNMNINNYTVRYQMEKKIYKKYINCIFNSMLSMMLWLLNE